MRHSATYLLLLPLMMTLLVQLSLSDEVQPVLASRALVATPPLTDVATADSAYPTNTLPGSATSLWFQGSNCGSTTSRYIEPFLKFDVSSIPPQATVISATLSSSLSYAKVSATVGVYYETNSNWSQATLDWNNRPGTVSGSTLYSSNFVSNSTGIYQWDITQVLASYLSTQSELTFILFPTSSESANCNGWISFIVSSISLSITYSYASTSVSLSGNSLPYGSSVAVTGSTDPYQTQGTITLQYSTDQANWATMISQSGGSTGFNWAPPSAGTFYLRSQWQTSWNNGADSYLTVSGISTLVVNPAQSSTQLVLSRNTIILGSSITVTASISPGSASDGVVTLQYSNDGSTWNQLAVGTPSSGTFAYSWSPSSVGTFYLRATWSGDTNYLGSTSTQSILTVTHIPTSLILGVLPTARLNQLVTITATLRDNSNNPIAGAQLTFLFDSETVGTGTTDSSGTATMVFTPSASAGIHTVTVTYSGSNQYAPSSQQGTFQILPWQLVITSSAPNVSLVAVNNQNYSTDSSGKVVIQIPRSGSYTLRVNSPLTFGLGSRYAFVQWGDGSSTVTRTINIASDASLSIIVKIQYKLTVQSPYGSPTGDDWYDSGLNAQFTIHSPVDQQNGTRRVFLGWNKNSQAFSSSANGSLSMTAPATLQANWKKQYFLTITSEYGSPSGGGWNDADSSVKVAVQSPYNGTIGTRYVLTGFVGTGAAPRSGNVTQVVFTISSPSSLTLSWKPQYFISIQSAGGTTSGGGGWYDGGATVTITATSPSAIVQNVSRLIFVGWTGIQSSNKTIQFAAGEPYNITANWVQQYYVAGSTTMGQIEGTGWYNNSSTATIKVSPTAFGFLIQQVFNGWVDQQGNNVPDKGGVSTLVVSGPVNLHATWRTDYTQLIVLVAVVAGGGGAGGFYLFRKRKGHAPIQETVAKVEPQSTEPAGQTVIEQQLQPEVGTSVYTGTACPVCGTVNPVGAVFCGSCGADLQRQKN